LHLLLVESIQLPLRLLRCLLLLCMVRPHARVIICSPCPDHLVFLGLGLRLDYAVWNL